MAISVALVFMYYENFYTTAVCMLYCGIFCHFSRVFLYSCILVKYSGCMYV